MEKEKLTVREEYCPYCGSRDIENVDVKHDDNMVCDKMRCNSCHKEFENWYEEKLTFVGQNVDDNCMTVLNEGDVVPDEFVVSVDTTRDDDKSDDKKD